MLECLRRLAAYTTIAALLAAPGAAAALDLQFGDFWGQLDSRLSVGVAVRTEKPDSSLIGKQNLDPTLCGESHCMSLSGDPEPNQRLIDAPGAFFGSMKDDGNLNYDQWDVVSAIGKFGADLSGEWRGLRFRLGGFVYFDAVNHDFDERHPDTTHQPAYTPRFGEAQTQLGRDGQIREAFVSGSFEALGLPVTATVGYQRIRWGESTFVALNSLDQINPPSNILLHQPGTPVADVFLPVPAVLLSALLSDTVTLDLVYELAWEPVAIDPGGAFYSTLDVIERDWLVASSGQAHEDPQGLQRLPYPANEISETSFTIDLLDESVREPRNSGQIGLKLNAYLPDFLNGTELSLYALNYHSQLPYFSVVAAQESCMRDAVSFVEAFLDCNGFIGLNPETGLEPLPMDTTVGLYEYPEDIQMYGFSFNTTLGKWSLAGEYSIRPNLPLQIHFTDMVYAGFRPAFPREDVVVGADPAFLTQTVQSLGGVIGNIVTTEPAQLLESAVALLNGLPVVLDVAMGDAVTIPAADTAVPAFVTRYRGREAAPGELIHGYERFAVDQIDITAIRAFGGSENPFGASQVLLVAEVGLTHIWGLPPIDELQIEGGDHNETHASPGVDGTGDGGEVNASRLNPTQQTGGFATEFAWGYRLMATLEYNNLLFDWKIMPNLIWTHDVSGVAPWPQQGNFSEGSKQFVIGTMIEFGPHLSTQIQYQGFSGGGTRNGLKDRDTLALSVAYNF